MPRHDFVCSESPKFSLINVALVGVDNLSALSKLLAAEPGAALFADLALAEQMSIFNVFESTLAAVRNTLGELEEQTG